MKKILSILLVTIVTCLCCFAADYPRWKAQPIYVYIPEDAGQTTRLMRQAFDTWQNNSRGTVRFRYVKKPTDSNIEVEFPDFASNSCHNINAVGCTYSTFTDGGRYLSKAYVTIGMKEYKYTYENSRRVRTLVNRPTENIYGAMLHEIGHALGFLEHASDYTSIMYPTDLKTQQYLTKEDLNKLYQKYH